MNYETRACKISHSCRKALVQKFQDQHVAPSKLYHGHLLKLMPEQYAAGNRDGVASEVLGCSKSVLQKISSEGQLQMEEDRDIIVSLLSLQRKMMVDHIANSNVKKKNVLKDTYSTLVHHHLV